MPKKIEKEPPGSQSARFIKEVERLRADGELNPIEADDVLDRLLRKQGLNDQR